MTLNGLLYYFCTQCSSKSLHLPVWWKRFMRQGHSGWCSRINYMTKSCSYDLWYTFLVSFDHLSLFIHLFDRFGSSWCLVLVFLLQRVYSWTPGSCFQLEIKKKCHWSAEQVLTSGALPVPGCPCRTQEWVSGTSTWFSTPTHKCTPRVACHALLHTPTQSRGQSRCKLGVN